MEERDQQEKEEEAHKSTKEREKEGDKVGGEGGVNDLLWQGKKSENKEEREDANGHKRTGVLVDGQKRKGYTVWWNKVKNMYLLEETDCFIFSGSDDKSKAIIKLSNSEASSIA